MSRFSSIIKTSKRIFSQGTSSQNPRNDFYFSVRKLVFNLSGYNQYGLYSHDVMNYLDPLVEEALRRIPRKVVDARNFRIIRAFQLDFLKARLPKEEWITFEQDLEYRYLNPYLEEIAAEKMEIYEFGCVNYNENDWPSGVLK